MWTELSSKSEKATKEPDKPEHEASNTFQEYQQFLKKEKETNHK